MNTTLKTLLAVGAAAGMGALPVYGFAVNVEAGSYQSNGGGEFVALIASPNFLPGYAAVAKQTVVNNSGASVQGFSTFCLEFKENINFNDNYDGTLNSKAFSGGVDNHDIAGNPAGDPLSKGTTLLYCQFATGTLAGYNYNGTAAQRTASARELQNAIWYLEDEITLTAGQIASNPFLSAAAAAYTDLAGAQANAAPGENNVQAINLVLAVSRRNAQDILVYNPPPSRVPDNGATLVMLGAGILGLALVRRQKNA